MKGHRFEIRWPTARTVFPFFFVGFAFANFYVLVEANLLALTQSQQPYDFYVLLHAASQIFSSPASLYGPQGVASLGPFWGHWLWDGANYLYTPMFASLIYPLTLLDPPSAKLVWEGVSFLVLVTSCALVTRAIPWMKVRLIVPLLVFVMPIQVLYTNQTLPQYWLPQSPAMWISPTFYADYYWGNSNAMILALGLLAFYFAATTRDLKFGKRRIPSYVSSALFLALASFKLTPLLPILPFWLFLLRGNLKKAVGSLAAFIVILNGAVLVHPELLGGYFSAILYELPSPNGSPLWQVYDYVWYYTLPMVGALLVKVQGGSRVLPLEDK